MESSSCDDESVIMVFIIAMTSFLGLAKIAQEKKKVSLPVQ